MQWEPVYEEQNPWPWGYRSSVFYDVTEFLLREEVTGDEVVNLARQVFSEHGVMVLQARLWMPEGRGEKSRRWLSELALTSSPEAYPQGFAPQGWGWLIGLIVTGVLGGLGAWWADKKYEEVSPWIEELLEALPAFFMLGVMFIAMQMMR